MKKYAMMIYTREQNSTTNEEMERVLEIANKWLEEWVDSNNDEYRILIFPPWVERMEIKCIGSDDIMDITF
jgi:hypothetical protein